MCVFFVCDMFMYVCNFVCVYVSVMCLCVRVM